MSLITELRQSLERFDATIQQLDKDITELKRIIDEHFTLNAKLMPPKMMQSIEKDLKL